MNNRMEISIGRIVTREPFYSSIILGLEIQECPGLDTFGTDGKRIIFDPVYLKQLDDDELIFVNLHETEHNARLHPWRRQGRDHDTWNRACDFVINWALKNAGYKMPKDGLLDARFANMSEEQVYAVLWKEQGSKPKGGNQPQPPGGQPGQPGNQPGGQPGQPGKQPGGKTGKSGKSQPGGQPGQPGGQPGTQPGQPGQQPGQGQPGQPGGQPGRWGEVFDCPGSEAEVEEARQQAIVEVLRAAQVAKSQGKLPGHFASFVEQIKHPKVTWKELLRNYLTAIAKDDYSWLKPNLRYVDTGFYIPSLANERCGTIAVAIDTSGSIGQEEFDQFVGELREIIEGLVPEKIIVIQCDAQIQDWQIIEDATLDHRVKLQGGGGTDFRPVFSRLEKEGETVQVLIYLTDGYGTFPKNEPDYPVLWAMTTDQVPPWGEHIQIENQ